MNTSFFPGAACRSTISVPRTFVSMVWTGSCTMSFTPTAAARWKTTSARSIMAATSGSLKTVSMVQLNRGAPSNGARFSLRPVDRLSSTST